MFGGQLGQAREVAAVVLGSLHERRHRHQACHGHGASGDEVGERVGGDAGLLVLAGHVHLHEHLLRRVLLELCERRLRRERVDQPHVRRHVLDLAALELADEVPGEQVAVRLLLGEQLLGPVLAHQFDAGLGQRRQVISLDVFDRGEDLHLGADLLAHPLEVAPYAFRIHRAR